MSIKKHVVKSTAMLAGMTMLSRILGLIRDMTTASVLGAALAFDAFVVAFTIPNLFRSLLGEGALNGAFVPVFSEALTKEGKEKAFTIANVINTVLSLILIGIVLLGLLILFGLDFFVSDSERLSLIVNLTKIMLPYLAFACGVGLLMGMLNSLKKFFVPGLSPIILNVVMISSLLFLCPLFGDKPVQKVYGLAIAVPLVGICQLLLQFFTLRRQGFRLKFNLDLKHESVRKIFTLVVPAFLGLSITQINVLIDRFLCVIIGTGAASSLYYSTRLVQLPIGLFTVSMATVMLPLMSRYKASGDVEKLKEALISSVKTIFYIVFPCMMGLLVLGKPIIRLLFERGRFDALATDEVYFTIVFFCIGMFAMCSVKLVVTAFHAVQDTKTPMKSGFMAVCINIVLNLILMQFLRQGGLALATSISSIFNFSYLLYALGKKIGPLGIKSLLISFARNLFFSLVMGGICFILSDLLNKVLIADTLLNRMILVFVPIGAGAGVIFLLGFMFKAEEFMQVYKMLPFTGKAK